MSEGTVPETTAEQNDASRAAWEANAAGWDDQVGEGNRWHKELIDPATLQLLDIKPGELVLDAACGNGLFSRQLAQRGANVIGFDQSPTLIERARMRSEGLGNLRFEVADATDPLQLGLLVAEPLDAVICMQAFMTMADIGPLVSFARQALKPGGRFVFTLQHPCFNNDYAALDVQRSLNDEFSHGLVLSGYKQSRVDFGRTTSDLQARPLYFHRPIEEILGVFFRAGFVLDGLLEPAFEEPAATDGRPSWENLWQIPPVLACRMVVR